MSRCGRVGAHILATGRWIAPAVRHTVGLARAAHFEPTVAVTGGSAALAAIAGSAAVTITTVTATVAASQLAIGWHNDWVDARRDGLAGRTEKPIVAGTVSRGSVGRAWTAATVLTLVLAPLNGFPAGAVAVAGLLFALLYNWPLKSTPLSVVPYAFCFAALPAFAVLTSPGNPPPPWWLLAAGASIGAGAHFANVLPDLEADALTHVHGLPQRLGRTPSMVAAVAFMVLATALLAFAPPGAPGGPGLSCFLLVIGILGAGLIAERRSARSGGAFRATLLCGLVDVVLLFFTVRQS